MHDQRLTMIRNATPSDIQTIVALGHLMHLESRFKALPYASDKVSHIFTQLIDGKGFAMVAEKDSQIVGVMGAIVMELWFSTVKAAQDFGLFIHPDHRGGMHAVRLLKAYEAWAKRQGVYAVEMGINTGVKVEETGRLLSLLGYTQVATLHSKEI